MFLKVAGSTFDIRKVSLKFQLGVMPPFFLDVFVNEWVINSRVGTLFGEWKTLLTSQPTRSKIHAHWPRWNPQSIDSWQNHFHLRNFETYYTLLTTYGAHQMHYYSCSYTVLLFANLLIWSICPFYEHRVSWIENRWCGMFSAIRSSSTTHNIHVW